MNDAPTPAHNTHVEPRWCAVRSERAVIEGAAHDEIGQGISATIVRASGLLSQYEHGSFVLVCPLVAAIIRRGAADALGDAEKHGATPIH
jgi:hypothetical protein